MKTVYLSAVATALALSTLAIGQTYQVTESRAVADDVAAVVDVARFLRGERRDPRHYDMPGTANSWTSNDSQNVNVTFNVPAPGGSWDPSDNGTYEVRVSANQVSDIAGNKHPGGVIATFSVGIQTAPSFSMTIPASATAGTPVSLTPTASSSYPSAVGDVFTYTIDWDGDGAGTQTIAGTSGALIAHTFTSIGTHTVRARCTDPHGVVSSERTATVVVSNSSVGLQSAVVLEAPAGATAGNTVATVKDGTIYFFGQQIENGTQAFTWDYLTPGAGFIVRGDLDIGPIPAGTGVDSRGRIVIYGGYEFGGVATPSCLTYTIAGGVGGGVANMPAAVYLGQSTSDNLSRL